MLPLPVAITDGAIAFVLTSIEARLRLAASIVVAGTARLTVAGESSRAMLIRRLRSGPLMLGEDDAVGRGTVVCGLR